MSKTSITIILTIFFFITYSGIYLIPQFGIRSDHIIIYSLFALVCVYFFLLNRSIKVNDSVLYLISFLIIRISNKAFLIGEILTRVPPLRFRSMIPA